MISIAEHAALLRRQAVASQEVPLVAAQRIGLYAQALAKGYIGREMSGWPRLAERTIADKQRLGFVGHVSATDPLLRTGSMRDSIVLHVVQAGNTASAVIGSAERKALWQEMGTARIPPRPFLSRAMRDVQPAAEAIIGAAVRAVFGETEFSE